MCYTALICVRGGSKGLPGKNIRPLAGKPLLAWAIECAAAARGVDRVIVSTDSPEIAEVAIRFGAEVPFIRPADLARDESPEWLAWRHAAEFLREKNGYYPPALLSVPATAPLRAAHDVEKCLAIYEQGNVDIVLTVTDSRRNPFFNMVQSRPDGTVGLVIPPTGRVFRRQDAPAVYDITTVCYVVRPEFLATNNGIFEGRVRAVHVPLERAIDIDTALDFEIAEFLMQRRARASSPG